MAPQPHIHRCCQIRQPTQYWMHLPYLSYLWHFLTALESLDETAGLESLDDAAGLESLDETAGLESLDETAGLESLDDESTTGGFVP